MHSCHCSYLPTLVSCLTASICSFSEKARRSKLIAWISVFSVHLHHRDIQSEAAAAAPAAAEAHADDNDDMSGTYFLNPHIL